MHRRSNFDLRSNGEFQAVGQPNEAGIRRNATKDAYKASIIQVIPLLKLRLRPKQIALLPFDTLAPLVHFRSL